MRRRHPKLDDSYPRNHRFRGKPRSSLRARLQGLSRPEVYLKAVILGAGIALIGLPLTSDLAIAASVPVRSGDTSCRIVSVTDGDTVRVWCRGTGPMPARLRGFDTPELFSPRCPSEYAAALQAKWRLRLLILTGGEVRMIREGRDHYDRLLVRMFVDGVPVARTMIAEGHARPYDGGQRQGWCS